MGSVALDAVNSSFPHQDTFRNAPGAPEPYRSPPRRTSSPHKRSDTPMSSSGRGASGSSTVRASPQTQRFPTQPPTPMRNVSRRSSQSSQLPTMPARLSNTPLTTTTEPPTDAGQASVTAGLTPAMSSQRSRPAKIKVRDLEHIHSFASQDMNAFSEIRGQSLPGSRDASEESPQYEISEMKVEHIIEMVAGLLTKITMTNDQQHEHLHRQPPNPQNAAHLSPQTTSVLAFHGKNVPSITILSYLSRINKYCPTSYEVFLSLLVYFDRMTERVNAAPMQSLRRANEAAAGRSHSVSSSSGSSATSEDMEGVTSSTPQPTQTATPPASGDLHTAAATGVPGTPHSKTYQSESPPTAAPAMGLDQHHLSHFFVVDSFNIHRLVIAGVTCASKFFSDIFYTNSRYAKVGGLPLPELNHLEIQFLRLNDFRLSIAVEEIEAYATMLVEFYAREVVAQQKAAAEAETMQLRSLSESSSDSVATVRAS